MNNLIFGITTFISCSIIYYYSWLYFKKDRTSLSLALIIISGILLRVFAASDHYIHQWDESFHGLVAKNLIDHPLKFTLYNNPILPYDYKNWSSNHIWLHKPPLTLWTIAASIWAFGCNEFSVRIPSILLSSLGIWLTFKISMHFYNKQISLLAAFLFSKHGLIIAATGGRVGQDHVDVFFMFFIELAVLFSIQFVRSEKIIYNILTGVSIGAAILTKWLPALIVLPISYLIMLQCKKFNHKTIFNQLLIIILSCIIIALPWQLYISLKYPTEAAWEYQSFHNHFTEVLEGHSGSFFFYFDWLRIIYGDIVYIPIIWFLWKTIKHPKNLVFLIFTIWFLIPYLFFSFAKTKTINYTLFTSPAIFIIIAYYWNILNYKINKVKYKPIAILVLILLIALPIRYTTEKIRCFESRETNPVWATELRELGKTLNNNNSIIFNVGKPIETMFYTNAIAYSLKPNNDLVKELINKGFTVYINHPEKNIYDLKDDEKVIFLNLSQ